MPRVTVQANFDCKHSTPVEMDLDSDVVLPSEVRGVGKCAACMEESNLMAVSGVQPGPDGQLTLDTVFLMPIES